MGVATHLGIKLREYDTRIRTFIPDYEEMLQAAASVVPANSRKIVDSGIGTGALSACCMRNARRAQIFGIDADARMMDAAVRRLHGRAELMCGNFIRADLPTCEAVVARRLHYITCEGDRQRRSFIAESAKYCGRVEFWSTWIVSRHAIERSHASRWTRGGRT